MSFQYVGNHDVEVLLNRRKEIRAEINKLEAENHAIEHVLLQLHSYEHPTGISIETEIQRLQKLKEEEDKFSGRKEEH